VIGTALKRGIADDAHVTAAIESMLRLNRIPEADAHGCTDITGFGLLGHAREMAVASAVTLEIDSRSVRYLPGALQYAAAGAQPGGLKNNREFVSPCVEMASELAPEVEALLYDPQTSGGLLLSLPANAAERLLAALPDAFHVGRVLKRQGAPLRVL
jgi:selenide, water dikinase